MAHTRAAATPHSELDTIRQRISDGGLGDAEYCDLEARLHELIPGANGNPALGMPDDQLPY
jgi:hypothetical protein